MQSSARPSISLIPLVHDNNDHPAFHSPRKHYHVSRTGIPFCPHRAIPIARYLAAVILSGLFFVALLLLAVFIALFTSFVQAQESAAAASETPS
jgi:hypothetical protein